MAGARHGRGTAWALHGHGMQCVNRPLPSVSVMITRVAKRYSTSNLECPQANPSENISPNERTANPLAIACHYNNEEILSL